ncbi:MAG: EF2563 family selenium-dependent molybdenum hydroxylase system protein [Treponema sp.]|nr:EF2563 family selenium-dependent molybdenum hydroxylase system protein [Treponema sp.]
MNLYRIAADLEDRNRPFVLATIVESSGSSPRSRAKMIIEADGTCHGTIGGGRVEARVIEEARACMSSGKPRTIRFDLSGTGPDPMLCGGAMTILLEPGELKPRLLLVGAGHVNLALARAAAPLGFRIAVADDRPDLVTSDRFPMASELYGAPSLREALEASMGYVSAGGASEGAGSSGASPTPAEAGGTCVLIATASHASDEEALRYFIDKPAAYLGMLGSRRKTRIILERLSESGVPEEALARVRAPVGLDIGAETPEEIAVSILGEILAERSGRSGGFLTGREGDLVVVRGAGDLATGVILRLARSGFRVVALESPRPTAIRRTVAFSEAVYDGTVEVEGLRARRAEGPAEIRAALAEGLVPVAVDPEAALVPVLRPAALVDAILAKRNLGTRVGQAPAVIALGPGFEAGRDADAVVETARGHDLGRVILEGFAAPNTGLPGEVGGKSAERVVRATAAGELIGLRSIGDKVRAGEPLLMIETPSGRITVPSPLDGVLRGLIRPGIPVSEGDKIADVDPRGRPEYCRTVSDKARAVAGGVLEALLYLRGRTRK